MSEQPKWWAFGLNAIVATIILFVIGILAASKKDKIPGRLQNAFELALSGLRNLYKGIVGDDVDRHLPFLLSLFFYIFFCNMIGLIPGFRSPTANLSTTLALALIVFFYVQYTGIRAKGILGYLRHFLGPLLFLAPLFIIIEVVGELAKPVSLSFRLYGNIYGEDVINALVTKAGAKYFLPLQFFVYLLQIFTNILQAFIFTLLTSAYISIMSAHHDENGDHNDSHPHQETVLERVDETTSLAASAPTTG